MMEHYKILSVLLCYPEQELIDSLPLINGYLKTLEIDVSSLNPLLDRFASNDLISVQENYVQTFDRTPSHSLHLFEHIHGEDRLRGQAMVDLLNEYQLAGFDQVSDELPDYLPLFLEFLSVCDAEKARSLLGSAIHVISHVGKKLRGNESEYASIFELLETLTPVKAEPLIVPPIRDMDEALEKFGPNVEGIEPLLTPSLQAGVDACMSCAAYTRTAK